MERRQKASAQAGLLMRKIIMHLRAQKIALPLQECVIIAVSGGSDSLALAHLLTTVGHNVVSKEKIRVLHIHHGLRGEKADEDALFVKDFAHQHHVPYIEYRLSEKNDLKGKSVEHYFRLKRKFIFSKVALQEKGKIWTAHHADDLAETMLWRILTGAFWSHQKGIQAVFQDQIRPFLTIRKKMLQVYLEEQKQGYKEDASNFNNQYLRSRIRLNIMPLLEKQFPQAIRHLCDLSVKTREEKKVSATLEEALVAFISCLGVRPRRDQIESFAQVFKGDKDWQGSISLAQGWKLVRCREKSR